MRLIIILLLLNCAVFEKSTPLKTFPANTIQKARQANVFIISSQETYKNGIKIKSDANHYHLVDAIRSSNLFTSIETDIDKADHIIEIDIETRRADNFILPFLTVFTLSLVPYFQRIEIKENFRFMKKNGEILYEANRNQKLNYWFGFFFLVNGLIQLNRESINNHPGFEIKLAEDLNQNIVSEMSSKLGELK